MNHPEPDIESIISSIADSQTVDWGSNADRAHNDDPELVEMLRIIERVVQAHQRAPDRGDPDGEVPFQTWGHLRLHERVGRGSYGEVYRAWDANLDREVALKLFHADAQGTLSFLEREELLEEARTLAKLRQENIVRVHGADVHEGRVGFWMDYIVGETLNDDLLNRGAKSPDEVVAIGIKVCQALAAAHSAGVLHRDVKASNIVREVGGHIYLMDFGAGALLRGSAERSGQRVGTPLYMAPEVLLEGKSSPQSDIYSLGVFLFHALTLRYPHEGDGLGDLVEAHRSTDKLALESLRPDLSKALRQTVERCLRSKPAERFASATAVEDSLREVLAPHRPATSSAVNALLAAVIVIVLVTQVPWSWLRDRVAGASGSAAIASVAVLDFDDEGLPSEEATYLAFGMGSHLTDRLSDLKGVRVTPWVNAKRFSPRDAPLREAAEALNVDALVVGSLSARGNQVSGSVSLIDGATQDRLWTYAFEEDRVRILEVERTISEGLGRAIVGGLTPAQREALQAPAARSVDAYELHLRGAVALQGETEEANDEAYEYFQRALDIDPQLQAARIGMGAVHLNRYFFGWKGGYGNLAQAQHFFGIAHDADPDDHFAIRGLCMTLYEDGRAVESMRMAMDHALRHTADAEALLTLAHASLIAGLPSLACRVTEHVLEHDPSNMAAAWIRVSALAWDDRFASSIEAGEEYFTRFGEDHEVHTWVGFSYLALGQYTDALIHLQRATSMHTNNIYVSIYLAIAATAGGQQDLARSVAGEAFVTVQARLEASPDNARLMWYAIVLAAVLGRTDVIATLEERVPKTSAAFATRGMFTDPEWCTVIDDRSSADYIYVQNYLLLPSFRLAYGIDSPSVGACLDAILEAGRRWENEFLRARAGELAALGIPLAS